MTTFSVPNTIAGAISSTPLNNNFTALVNSGNSHDQATTGVHGMGGGTLMGTTLAQTVTGAKTFSGANSIRLPTSAPSATGAIGIVGGVLQYWNGSSVTDVGDMTLNTAQTVTGAKTFSGANSIRLPTTAPSATGAVGIVGGVLQYWNGSTAVSVGSGSGDMLLGTSQTVTGAKTFSGVNTLIIPTTAPTATSGSIGLSSGILQVHDGTAARTYSRLDSAQTITGAKTFSGANTLLIPTTAPTAGNGSVGLSSGILQVHDGTSARTYSRLDSAQTITGAKTFSGANTLIIPTTAPTATSGSIGLSSGVLQAHDGTAARTYARLDNAQTFTGAKTFSGANTLIVPTDAPSATTGSLGFHAGNLRVYDGASALYVSPVSSLGIGTFNIGFKTGGTTAVLRITSANGSALSATNPGFVTIKSTTMGTATTFTVTADVDITLTNAHWALSGKGDVTGALLRVYACNDAGTLKWGVGYQGGFKYIAASQDNTTASSITTPHQILSNSNITSTANCLDVGYITANYTDSGNAWEITATAQGESADGLWQPWSTGTTGFSSLPTVTIQKWMQVGSTVYLRYVTTGSGTSNSTNYGLTAPIVALTSLPATAQCTFMDNGVTNTTQPCYAIISGGGTGVTLYTGPSATTWTSSGNKRASVTNFQYEGHRP